MFKFLFIINLFVLSLGAPNNQIQKCCINHHKKKNNDLSIANYNCEQLTNYGEDRCNSVLSGTTCKWESCPQIGECSRVPKYELHYGKKVDVGSCSGLCKKSLDQNDFIKPSLTCSPLNFDYLELKKGNVKVIKDCACQNCGVQNKYDVIKVPVGSCRGECQQRNNSCLAGVVDKYDLANGIELSNPSINLINSANNICPLGIQNGFDHFIDNRCFVHTFEKCLKVGLCPIQNLILAICMQAAQVSLTQTDSIRLGTNGIGLWGMGLPTLNGGSWNPGDNICLNLDLNNLPGGNSILNSVIVNGNLDVLVQDDTAVDFLRLNVNYKNCEECLAVDHTVHSFYTSFGLQEFRHIRDCDCLKIGECHREKLEETFYPSTNFEVSIDVGQCLGNCPNGNICNKKSEIRKIKTPYGVDNIEVISDCVC